MASILSHRSSQSLLLLSPRSLLSLSSSLTSHRHRSNKSGNKFAHLIEVDLDSSSSAVSPDISVGVRRLEDVIYNIIVRRSAPDWLPFLPGSSYWVPPRKRRGPSGLADVIGSLAAAPPMRSEEETLAMSSVRGWPSSEYYIHAPPMRSEEKTFSLSSVRGWPSSAYYIHGSAPARPVPMDVQVVEVKFQEDSDSESQTEDEGH